MAQVELRFPCPLCGYELSAECGMAAHLIRATMQLRSSESRVWVECENCGREVTMNPAGEGLAHPVGRIPLVRL